MMPILSGSDKGHKENGLLLPPHTSVPVDAFLGSGSSAEIMPAVSDLTGVAQGMFPSFVFIPLCPGPFYGGNAVGNKEVFWS